MKRVMCAVLTALLLSQGIPAAYAAEQTKPASSGVEVSAKSVILMERETGTVLYQQAEHEQREPASVTKIMTMLLVVEAIEQGQLHLEDMVTCSAYAASMDQVIHMLDSCYPDIETAAHLDGLHENFPDLNVIAIYDRNLLRFYHTTRRESG